jgi:hypothetical protein
MILTGEIGSAGRKTCRSATMPTTDLTWTGVGLNPVLRAVRLMINRVGQDTVLPRGGCGGAG